jgi:hypothetical protein
MTTAEQFGSEARIARTGEPLCTAQQLFVAFVPALVLFGLIAFAPSVIPDGDPYWHIAAGNWILTHGAVPTTDPFSHTLPNAPWTAHEWLSEIILATSYQLGGWSGLHLLVAVAAMATAFLLARELLKYLDPIPALIVLQFALANVVVVAHARPQFLTFPIMVVWLGQLIEARRQDRAPHWTLLPLMVLWANMHGSFILGLALIGPFALEAALAAGRQWQKALLSWILFGLGALGAALINPTGFEGLLFPLKLMSMSSLSYIAEWQSSSFERFGPFEAALLAALFFCLFRGVRIPLVRLLVLLGMLHQALAHRRFTIVFAIGAALLLAEPIMQALKPKPKDRVPAPAYLRLRAGAAVALAACCIALLRMANPVRLDDDANTPVSALAHVPATLLQQPVFNEYRFGGYLIFNGIRPFIDGRADMYGDDFVRQFREIGQQKPQEIEELFAKHAITWAIVYPSVERERLFEDLYGWRRLYKDDHAAVYARGLN